MRIKLGILNTLTLFSTTLRSDGFLTRAASQNYTYFNRTRFNVGNKMSSAAKMPKLEPMTRMIIDTDVGLDDAQALMMALSRTNIGIEGITAVHGNAGVDQVCKNIRKVLQVCHRLDVKVYRGCSESLIVDDRTDFTSYHGMDGLGDVIDLDVTSDDVIEKQHAVNYLVEQVNQFPKQISLICLGPLTNIAMAMKLDKNFGEKLKECHIMGGNYQGRGNVTSAAEFNFHSDPEAAYISLQGLKCETTISGWECCIAHPISWSDYVRMVAGDGHARKFIRVREAKGIEWMKKEEEMEYVLSDQLAMAVALEPSVVKQSFKTLASVELHGSSTRGQMVVDRKSADKNVTVITELDIVRIIDMIIRAMDRLENRD